MEWVWRLMTAIFLIAAGLGILVLAWVLGGGMLRDVVPVLMAYAGLILILIGIVKGFLVIYDYHKNHRNE